MAAFTLFLLLVLVSMAKANRLMEDRSMFEGDIELRPEQKAAMAMEKAGLPTFAMIKDAKWPLPIPYEIDYSLAYDTKATNSIREAHREMERLTCLRFRRKHSGDKEYIKYTNGNGCFSPVGYSKGRVNRVQLADGCRVKQVVIHETLHSLGFWHEQTRPDRDRYVYIDFSNINKFWHYAFRKRTYGHVDSKGSPYDYESIMHYSKDAFAKDYSRPTIITLDRRYQDKIGQAKGMSVQDIYQVKLKYCY